MKLFKTNNLKLKPNSVETDFKQFGNCFETVLFRCADSLSTLVAVCLFLC